MKIIYAKSDKMFENAAVDEAARKALIQQQQKVRSFFIWLVLVIVIFFFAMAAYLFYEALPIFRGNFASFHLFLFNHNKIGAVVGFLSVVAVFSTIAARVADNQVKMLILIDRIENEKITPPAYQ